MCVCVCVCVCVRVCVCVKGKGGKEGGRERECVRICGDLIVNA